MVAKLMVATSLLTNHVQKKAEAAAEVDSRKEASAAEVAVDLRKVAAAMVAAATVVATAAVTTVAVAEDTEIVISLTELHNISPA